MKRQLCPVVAVLLIVLPACASNGSSRYANERKFVVDQQYVDAVEHASRQAGVRVTWVNPPTRRVPVGDGINN